MGIMIDSTDIESIIVNHREDKGTIHGYAIVHLKKNISSAKTFHFNFSMTNADFDKQLKALHEASDKSGFRLKTNEKSRIGLRIEMALVGALSGLEYRNHACPSCRMIDIFFFNREYS